MKRCRNVLDKECPEGYYFHPECWGGVNGGIECCYCKTPEGNDEPSVEERLERLERQIAKLVKTIEGKA